jgi:DNA-binding MarR family transcriptional regulator
VRQTQLATLRAIQAGADTVALIAGRLRIPRSSATHRVATLKRDGYVERYDVGNVKIMLTTKAKDLLARRAELDGEQ